MYAIKRGCPCFVRCRDEKEWRTHKTSKKAVLEGISAEPGYLLFKMAGWEMKIAGCHVRRVSQAPP